MSIKMEDHCIFLKIKPPHTYLQYQEAIENAFGFLTLLTWEKSIFHYTVNNSAKAPCILSISGLSLMEVYGFDSL